MRFWLFGLLAMISSATPSSGAESRPNIVFLFADDWGRYASFYRGLEARPSPNQVVQTPHLDALAKRGVVFRNAYVSSPSCTPCRSALLTGRHFFRTGRGAVLHGAVWDYSLPVWPLRLGEAGYHLGKSYKVWGPGSPNDAPYGERKYAYEQAGRTFNKFSRTATELVRGGLSPEAARAKLLEQISGNLQQFLAKRGAGQPFCYWLGCTNTHRIWERGSGKALWGIDPGSLRGKMPGWLPDVPEVREDMADYLGEVQAWDAAVGVVLKELEARGELATTYFVLSGDHGMPGVPHGKCNLYDAGAGVPLVIAGPGIPGGRVVDDFTMLPDLAPTIYEWAQVPPPAGMDGRSLGPILRADKSGQVDPARTWVLTGRERHVAHARAGNVPYPQRALRTPEYLYIRNREPSRWPLGDPMALAPGGTLPPHEVVENETYAGYADMDASPTKAWLVEQGLRPEWKTAYDRAFAPRPAEELYVVANDPDQLTNVAADPKFAAVKKELAEQLDAELRRVGDPGLEGVFEKPPFTDPEPPRPQRGGKRPAE